MRGGVLVRMPLLPSAKHMVRHAVDARLERCCWGFCVSVVMLVTLVGESLVLDVDRRAAAVLLLAAGQEGLLPLPLGHHGALGTARRWSPSLTAATWEQPWTGTG